mgnify:CR=1 FL=1
MLMPKRVKRRKQFRGTMAGKALRGNKITNGEYGIVALEPAWIKSNQIEAARVAMTRYIKRGGKVWIKIFPDKPVTAKPAETRMGSGKGDRNGHRPYHPHRMPPQRTPDAQTRTGRTGSDKCRQAVPEGLPSTAGRTDACRGSDRHTF